MLIFYSALEQNLAPFVITKEQKEAYIKALDTRNTESLYQLAKVSQEFELTRTQGQMVLIRISPKIMVFKRASNRAFSFRLKKRC